MAAQYLAAHGVDLDSIMSKVQFGKEDAQSADTETTSISKIVGARLPRQDATTWDVSISDGTISSIEPHDATVATLSHIPGILNAQGCLLAPSLCHAHVHLDKCFLLQDPKYADLPIVKGDFAEAMDLTGKAKARFEDVDLLRRGSRFIEESVEAGVTAMRAFVEADEVVEMKCVDAAVKLKERYRDACEVQICAFAQLALFTGEDGGARRRELILKAIEDPEIDVIGSTPYVEADEAKTKQNIEWIVDQAIKARKHLDLHLDYNLDPPSTGSPPMIWHVLSTLHLQNWLSLNPDRTICVGHCTRLTHFTPSDWTRLAREIKNLPLSFVGLPTSDLFMMGRPLPDQESQGARHRGTLQIPQMIREYGLDGAISINNVGNAFTPQGSCDPLALATLGVGVYHAGTQGDAEVLYECVSVRAKTAIGLGSGGLEVKDGDVADFVLVGSDQRSRMERKTISEVVYDAGKARRTIYKGKMSRF